MAVFRWRHFAGEIILWAVRWYCRYGITYRELEEMMGERGVAVPPRLSSGRFVAAKEELCLLP